MFARIIPAVSFALTLGFASAMSDELLSNVTTDTWGLMSQGKIAYLDYHYATTTLFWAEVTLMDLATKTKSVVAPPSGSYPYYISYGFAKNHLAYILYSSGGSGGGTLGKSTAALAGGSGGNSGGRTSYLEYKDLSSGAARRLITSDAWKEMVWIGGDIVVWVDYRNLTLATIDSVNSEIYVYNLATSSEIRITNDHGYQEKPFTDGQRVVWIDYSAGYGKVFMYTISSNQTREIAPYSAGKNNPRVSGNYIVWEDYRNTTSDPKNVDIYMYDLSSDIVKPVCTAQRFQGNPYVSGNLIVWEDYRNSDLNPQNADIYLYNISASVERASVTTAGYQGHPTLLNDTLCWLNTSGSVMSLMMRDVKSLATGTSQIEHSGSALNPTIRMAPTGKIQIEGIFLQDATIELTDICGRCLVRKNIGSNNYVYAPSALAAGIFIVNLSSGGHTILSRRLVVH